jgi:hypothetical protein
MNNLDIIEKLGLKAGEWLGQGAFATVYAMADDPTKVIKVTGDGADAAVAELARRAQDEGKCQNLVRVYSVTKVPYRTSNTLCWDNHAYVIVAERLEPIPPEAHGHLPSYHHYIDSGAHDMMQAALRAADGNALRCEWALPAQTNVWSVAAANIKGMTDDLRSLGVTRWDDFKLNNVMLRPGDRIVVTDFGCTESPIPEIKQLAASRRSNNLPRRT